MRSLRNITRVLTLATSGKSLLSTVSRTAINLPMKRTFLLLLALLLPAAAAAGTPHWNGEQVRQLLGRLQSSGSEGLEPAAREAGKVRAALAQHDSGLVDQAATAAAVRLLKAHRTGCCQDEAPAYWRIGQEKRQDAEAAVADAVGRGEIDALFAEARPIHPDYLALARAYASETDPDRRAAIAANLDRWRWMPRALGARYLVVNAAAFEATLWQNNQRLGRWQVIVGKTKTPTPVFAAQVTGVTFNPWWEIPESIVAESVGKLVRTRPAEAARRGYVVQDGRYRQRPGPQNALGRMKLVMPNPYSIYLHDTPAQSLFERDVRAFSHGCVRVGDALGLATALLEAQSDWNRKKVDALVAAGHTVTVPLDRQIPVYVTYFTAEPDDLGGIRFFPDIYGRDPRPVKAGSDEDRCALQ